MFFFSSHTNYKYSCQYDTLPTHVLIQNDTKIIQSLGITKYAVSSGYLILTQHNTLVKHILAQSDTRAYMLRSVTEVHVSLYFNIHGINSMAHELLSHFATYTSAYHQRVTLSQN